MPDNNDNFPALETLLVIVTYGGVLAIIASSLSGHWSAVASLLMGYIIFLAPIIMGIIAYKNRAFRGTTNTRKWIFYAGTLYFIITPITGLLLVLFERYIQRA
jgi:uncharacterized membrane protein